MQSVHKKNLNRKSRKKRKKLPKTGKIRKNAVDFFNFRKNFSLFSDKLCFGAIWRGKKKSRRKSGKKNGENLKKLGKKLLTEKFSEDCWNFVFGNKKLKFQGKKKTLLESRVSGISKSVKNSVLKAISNKTWWFD